MKQKKKNLKKNDSKMLSVCKWAQNLWYSVHVKKNLFSNCGFSINKKQLKSHFSDKESEIMAWCSHMEHKVKIKLYFAFTILINERQKQTWM